LAKENHLTFVRLNGEIGCMVNGAGLAMATMDTIKYFNGSPANFLDAGGSSDPAKAIAGMKLILSDKRVKVIFINIFGGITRCDDVARGLLAAREQFGVSVPIVIRLVGTNEKEARAMIAGNGMILADTLEEGAQKAVEMGRKA
jgi:succinyl-CoA synthetase beta subunit